MMNGQMTVSQRQIAKRCCEISTKDYMKLLNWLINHHPHYDNMTPPEQCPSPIPLGGFNETNNNTEESEDELVENSFEDARFTFAPQDQPMENRGPYSNEKDFIFLLL